MSDDDLKLWKEISESSAAVMSLMKRRKFSGATGVRNHARFIRDRSRLMVSVEESRRTFYSEMSKERTRNKKLKQVSA